MSNLVANLILGPSLLLMMVLGTLALNSHRGRADNRAFFLQNCLGAFFAAASVNRYFGTPVYPDSLDLILNVVGLGWLWTMATFTYAFPTGRTPPTKLWAPLTLLTLGAMLFRFLDEGPLSQFLWGSTAVLLVGLSVILVLGAHQRSKGHIAGAGIFMVQALTIARLALIIFAHFYGTDSHGQPNSLMILEVYFAPPLVCAAFAYTLWRYQLLDVRFLLTRTIGLFAVGGVTAVLIVACIEITQIFFRNVGVNPFGQGALVAPGFVILLLMIFNPLKTRLEGKVEGWINRGLVRAKESSQNYYRNTEGVFDVEVLLEALGTTVAAILPGAAAAIVLSEPKTTLLAAPNFNLPRSQGNNPEQPFAQSTVLRQLHDAWQGFCILKLAPDPHPSLQAFRDINADVVMPFIVGQSNYGALILQAPAIDTARLKLLPALARHLGLQLTAALLIRQTLDANTQLRTTNQELANTRLFLETIVDSMPVGLAVIDIHGKVRRWTPKMQALTGLKSQSVLTSNELPSPIAELGDLQEYNSQPTRRIFQINEGEEQQERQVNLRVARLGAHNGEHRGYVLLFSDITQVVKLQKDLEQNRRLAALGQLAAAMAHEIRTPLTSIKLNVQILASKLDLNADDEEYFDIVLQELERLNSYVNEILDYARPVKLAHTEANIGELLDEVRRSLYFLLAERDTEMLIESEDVPNVPADGERLKQVFINLIDNASQAMEGQPEGKIRVEIKTANLEGQPGLEVLIRDTGKGMDARTCAQVFTPFFTTKATGTGLGLAIAQKIAHSHRGRLSVVSRLGKGSTFKLWLPKDPQDQSSSGS